MDGFREMGIMTSGKRETKIPANRPRLVLEKYLKFTPFLLPLLSYAFS
jgi:hypothetical protein